MKFSTKVTLCSVLVMSIFSSAVYCSDSGLSVYLPREVSIDKKVITLGDVCIINGPEELVNKTSAINLGKFSIAGQKMVFGKVVILSRLKSCNILKENVTMTGAKSITVRQKGNIVTGTGLANNVIEHIRQSNSYPDANEFKTIRVPQDFILPSDCNDIKLDIKIRPGKAGDLIRSDVKFITGNKVLGTKEVILQARYKVHSAVATRDIRTGEDFTFDNIKITESMSMKPEQKSWAPPYGKPSGKNIKAGTKLNDSMVYVPRIVNIVNVKRNENVLIKIEKPGLLITMVGKAMEKGGTGDLIKVKNIDSGKVIIARIKDDGTVEPVF